MMDTTTYYVVWNEAQNEGVIFLDKRDAESALDGRPFFDPNLGIPSMSALAEDWFQNYGDEDCAFEAVTLFPADT